MATTKRAFPAALEGFGRALAVMPDDARAYAERGYAQLLAKNFRLAREDFDRAVERTDDRKLLAQIWFNYGLTAEEEGRAEDARSAFARSNEMNPTEAASKRLGGVPTCTARVTETKPEEGAEESRRPSGNVDWLGVFERMARTMNDVTRPATPDQARSLLCLRDDCRPEPDRGVAVRLQSERQTAYGVVIATSDGKLRPFARLFTATSGPCGSKSEATVIHQQPLQLHVESSQMLEHFTGLDGQDCKDGQGDSCVRQCRPGTTVIRDYLFNLSGTRVPLEVHQWTPPNGKAPWAVTVSGTDARIQGSGCNVSWSLE
ncbi:MAG: tetratricopeptide repeat protein [Polyangiaceae bacterium]|nr:tetratricopeptide repeat protein [Polyangiaceae bacterium]